MLNNIRSILIGVVVIVAVVIVGLSLFFISQKGIEESVNMVATSSFEDWIILPTITVGKRFFFFFLIVIVNVVGLYLSDHEIDKQTAATNPSGRSYEYEWKEVMVMGISSAILTMGFLETYGVAFWMSLVLALLMGITFRPLLPELAKLASSKIKGFLEVAFGQYK
jgi:hypothetical protein